MATTFRNAEGTVTISLVTETCCNCGVVFAMTSEFKQQRIKDHNWFYCPAGHVQHYTGRDLEAELRAAKERLEAERGWARRVEQDLDHERRSHAATKGQLTKTRNRIQAGLCPDCKRHFTNLERHMHTKHGAAGAQPYGRSSLPLHPPEELA